MSALQPYCKALWMRSVTDHSHAITDLETKTGIGASHANRFGIKVSQRGWKKVPGGAKDSLIALLESTRA